MKAPWPCKATAAKRSVWAVAKAQAESQTPHCSCCPCASAPALSPTRALFPCLCRPFLQNLTELSFTEWTPEHTRDFSYLMPKSTFVGANHVVEHQAFKIRAASTLCLSKVDSKYAVPSVY